MSGERHNAGKPRFDLIPPDAEFEIAKVLTQGATKYSARNWEQGLSWSETMGSLRRHLAKWFMGEERDPESGCLHAAHVAVNAIFLLTFVIRKIGTDDRPNIPKANEPCQTQPGYTPPKKSERTTSPVGQGPYSPMEWGSEKLHNQYLPHGVSSAGRPPVSE